VNRKNSAIAYQNFAPNFLDHTEPCGAVSPELVKQTMEKAYVKYPDLYVGHGLEVTRKQSGRNL